MPSEKQQPAEATLASRVEQNIIELKDGFAQVIDSYQGRIQKELDEIAKTVKRSPQRKNNATLRDMLTILRNIQLRPEKGRRKDLKKIDSVVSDLALLCDDLKKRSVPKKKKDL